MIVYSQAFVLAAEAVAATSLDFARVCYQTWLRGLAASAVTASSETADGPKDSPLRSDTYSYWEPASLPATWVVDLGTTRTVDYVGVLGAIGSVGASVKVETNNGDQAGSPDLEDVWVAFSTEVAPNNDAPILFLDTAVTDARKIRITVQGAGSVPRIAVVYAGEALVMERTIYGGHTPITLARETTLQNIMSRGGQFLAQSFRKHGVTGAASFRHLTPAFVRDSFDPFVKVARQYPYFFAWRPGDWPLEVGYVWTPEDIHPSNMGLRELMQVSWNMVGLGNE